MKKYLWCFHLLSTLINADSNEIIMQVNNDSSIESTTLINEIATTEAAENHIAGMNYYQQQQNNLHQFIAKALSIEFFLIYFIFLIFFNFLSVITPRNLVFASRLQKRRQLKFFNNFSFPDNLTLLIPYVIKKNKQSRFFMCAHKKKIMNEIAINVVNLISLQPTCNYFIANLNLG